MTDQGAQPSNPKGEQWDLNQGQIDQVDKMRLLGGSSKGTWDKQRKEEGIRQGQGDDSGTDKQGDIRKDSSSTKRGVWPAMAAQPS